MLLLASFIKDQVLTWLVASINLRAKVLHVEGFLQIVMLSVLLVVVRAGDLMLSIRLKWKLLGERIVHLVERLLWLLDLACGQQARRVEAKRRPAKVLDMITPTPAQ